MAHISGSMVLMADLSWKDNSEIVIEDVIMGADLIPATVMKISHTSLRNKRMLSLLENQSAVFTEKDSLWARDDHRQWWWVENASLLIREWKEINTGLKVTDSIMVSYDVEFATFNGFEKQTIIDVTEKYSTDTIMPVFQTDRCCPVIINGQIVSSGINELIYDYTKFDWLDSLDKLKQLDREL